MNSQKEIHYLKETLVLSVRKSFWASKDCEIFPNRLYTKTLIPAPGRFGSSRNPINNFTVALQGYLSFLRNRPKLIIIGSSSKIGPWFTRFKKHGLLSNTKILVIGQGYLRDDQLEFVEKVIVYSRGEISLHDPKYCEKYEFMPLPADGDFDSITNISDGDYIFSGGGADRDFSSLIEAINDLDVRLSIITFSKKSLNFSGYVPGNCKFLWHIPRQEFLEHMAEAKFVVAPLQEGIQPHGHTTIVQALRLGKAIISTRNASIDDYVTHGQEGLLVKPGDIYGYRKAIIQLTNNHKLRDSCQQNAIIKGKELTYSAYANRLIKCVQEIIQ
jgi:glycosyltransferase involved in cell wall biosynthesis